MLLASELHARQLHGFAICNVDTQVISSAIDTERVLALETKEVAVLELRIAHVTHGALSFCHRLGFSVDECLIEIIYKRFFVFFLCIFCIDQLLIVILQAFLFGIISWDPTFSRPRPIRFSLFYITGIVIVVIIHTINCPIFWCKRLCLCQMCVQVRGCE